MMWPWERHRLERAEAKAAVEQAARLARETERRCREAEREAVVAAESSAKVRHQIEINGWTELLQTAWGGR